MGCVVCRNYYSSITLDVLESAYRVFVPEPEEKECKEQPVTLEDAQQAEGRAQLLWGRMQAAGGRQLTPRRLHSIGHYPAEDSSYCDSESQDDGDPGTPPPSLLRRRIYTPGTSLHLMHLLCTSVSRAICKGFW